MNSKNPYTYWNISLGTLEYWLGRWDVPFLSCTGALQSQHFTQRNHVSTLLSYLYCILISHISIKKSYLTYKIQYIYL